MDLYDLSIASKFFLVKSYFYTMYNITQNTDTYLRILNNYAKSRCETYGIGLPQIVNNGFGYQ